MAKIAGRKNDGAWFRWNKWILEQGAKVSEAVATGLMATETLPTAYGFVVEYIAKVGVEKPADLLDPETWAASISVGVPRQLWDGVTTYDYYTKVDGSPNRYVKLMGPVIFDLSVDIRAICKSIRFGEQEITWISQLHRTAVPVPPQSRVDRAVLRAARRDAVVAYLRSEEGIAAVAARKLYLTNSRDKSISPVLGSRTSQSTGGGGRSGKRATPLPA